MSDLTYAYDLRTERPIIAALVRQAVSRYRMHFSSRPVNAVEVGFWVEGARLIVRLVSDPAYEFNWTSYPEGPCEQDGRASYGEFTHIPSWELLSQLSGSRDMLVRDDVGEVRLHEMADGYQEGWRQSVEVIGRNVMRAVFDPHRELFEGYLLDKTRALFHVPT